MERSIVQRRHSILFVLCLWIGVTAQSNEWPLIFSVPVRPAIDTGKVSIATDTKVFENNEKMSNSLYWKPHVPDLWRMKQRFIYETSGDVSFDVLNQFYDFSGSITRDSVLPQNGSLGLEWTPTSYLNLRKSGGGFQTTSDLGPVMQWRVRNIPVNIRGGLSGVGWNENLPTPLIESRFDDFHGDAGYYGAFMLGDPAACFLGKPVYINAQAFGRSIRQAGIAGITGSALFASAARSGDSLFVYYGDSLSDGKENYWGSGTAGQPRYMSTPWRIARSLQAAGAIKTKERYGFQPSMIYSFAMNSVAYPAMAIAQNDIRVRMQTLNLLLQSRENRPVVYRGGIKFNWGDEERLFRKDPTTSDTISLETKRIGDHRNYIVASDHYLGVTLPLQLTADYQLTMFRNSKTYTFSYPQRGIERKNTNDVDLITIKHHLGIARQQNAKLDAELFGEYSNYLINYLRKENSAKNSVENSYRIGLNCSYQASERLVLNENISADAEISKYLYTEVHRGDSTLANFDPPPSQRRFSSLFSGQWKIGGPWELDGKLNASYFDKGKWYGREYITVDTLRSDYYAIETKSFEYAVEMSLAWVREPMRVKGGCLLRDNYDLSFNNLDQRYDVVSNGMGYFIEPFAETQLTFRHFVLKGRIARMINTLASDKWQKSRNWDIYLAGSAQW